MTDNHQAAGAAAAAAANKKRRIRKKKKKKTATTTTSAEDEAAAMEDEAQRKREQEEAKMNPHAKLRQQLHSSDGGGFSYEEIDLAMEEMWNKDLAYDEYHAVYHYLKSGGKSVAAEKEEDEEEEEEKPGKIEEPLQKEMDPPAVDNTKAKPPRTSASNSTTPAVAASTAPSIKAPTTMAARLDMVAGFDNLTDAIFALTEWVSKAAKLQELDDLCEAKKTKALPTIFRRSIAECDDQLRFEEAVLPAMARLMISLLNKCGISPTGVAATKNSFETLLNQARKVFLMEQPGAEDYATRVSLFVVSRIALALAESKANRNGSSSWSLNVDTSSLNGDTSSALVDQTDHDFAELLSKREIHKTSTKRSLIFARSACLSLSDQNGSSTAAVAPGNGASHGLEMDKSDIFLAIVGPDAKHTFDIQKTKLDALKAKAKEGETEALQGLRASADNIQSERESIAQQIAELKASIEKLEICDAGLYVQFTEVQAKIESETQSDEAKQLHADLKEATEAVKYGNSIGSLVNYLKNYDDSLDKALSFSLQTGAARENSGEAAFKAMDTFLYRARQYFASEATCVEFLRNRMEASAKEVADLRTEIEECEGLGMTTTIGQMEDSAKAKEELMVKDAALTERLSAEASSMFLSLVERLEQYRGIHQRHSLAPIAGSKLKGIPESAIRLGIANVENLDPFMAVHDLSLRATDPLGSPRPDSCVSPIGTPKAKEQQKVHVTSATAQNTTIPKFTWASASTTSDPSTQKTSLLDIQKEELKSKSET